MYTPFSNTRSNRHSRVHEMLKRSRHPPSSLSSSESLMKGTPTYSQAFASTMPLSQTGGGDVGGLGSSLNMNTLNNPDNHKVIVFICATTALTAVFSFLGRNVDALIQNYEDTKNPGKDYDTHFLMLVAQLCFNVAMLVVPCVMVHKYFPDSYVCRYYLVIAAFWTLSLHAQPFLKRRFYYAFALSSSVKQLSHKEDTNINQESDSDQQLIAQYLKDAETTSTPTITLPQHPETDNIQYRSSPATTPLRNNLSSGRHSNTPIHFESQDLMPAQSTHQHSAIPQHHESFQSGGGGGTNLADLF